MTLAINIIWACVVIFAVLACCKTANTIVEVFKPQEPKVEVKEITEVDEDGNKIPTMDDFIAAIYGREDNNE